MIILHAGFMNGRLYMWGEQSVQKGKKSPVSRRGRKPKGPRPKPYPYDMNIDNLARSLRESPVKVKPTAKRTTKVAVWLPTKGDTPVPSSPLIAEPSASRAKLKMAPWIVTAYTLLHEQTVEFLCVCLSKRTLAPGVVLGADLILWAEALRFAGSLVARQRYLPGLVAEENEYTARWDPVFSGNDAGFLAELAKRMPPVARAMSTVDTIVPPGTSAAMLLKEFISVIADCLVRFTISIELKPARKRTRKKRSFNSVHDVWFHALRSQDGIIQWDKYELEQLAAQIRKWRRPIAVTTGLPYRFCFRLEEPGEVEETSRQLKSSANTWYLRYLLQSYSDPSLLIPAREVWKSKGRKASSLKYQKLEVREYMLSSLGQAAGISPDIAVGLESAEPAGHELNTVDAHEFLTEKAIILEQAGFGVILPAWWTRKGTKVRLTARATVKSPKMQGGSGLSLETMIQFDWELALGGKKLTNRELRALAKLKAPLVRFRGQWVEVNASEIQAAIDFWKKNSSGQG